MSLTAITSDDWPGPDGDAAHVAVLLHGYGSNERDLAGLSPVLPAGLPWASLRAPIEMGYGGAAWFPLDGPDWLDPRPIDEATAAVWEWVDAHAPSGAPVAAVGFSQGGLMASQLLRTRPERVAATAILSGFVGRGEQPGDAALARERPAVFWGRGDADQVIPAPYIADTRSFLTAHAVADARVYPGLAHSINDAEARDLHAHLTERLEAG